MICSLPVNDLAPFYSVPDALVYKVAYGSIDIAHQHEAECDLYLACEQVNGCEIEDKDHYPVTECF